MEETDDAYLLDLKAKTGAVAYDRLKMRVDKEALVPTTIEAYAASGLLIKTLHYKEIKDFGDGHVPALGAGDGQPAVQGLQVGDDLCQNYQTRVGRRNFHPQLPAQDGRTAMNRLGPAAALCLLICLLSGTGRADELYSFDLDEFEKKPLNWGGYAEVRAEHFELNDDGAFAVLNHYREPRSSLNRLTAALQLDGRYRQGITVLNWLLKATAAQDEIAWYDSADIYAAYASVKASPRFTFDLGKKVFKWGKGYAWNPVAFIDRPKDPDDPEEAMEGFIGAEGDLVQSMNGPLRTAALTTVVLPVWQGVNEDFGAAGYINFAAKLYLLFQNTDIDFVYFTGDSRSSRYGLDFSKNLAANFEIHGEMAYTPSQQQKVLTESGSLAAREVSDTSYLAGLRYLSAKDVTTIVEYYHNGDGYSEDELSLFYREVADGYDFYQSGGGGALLDNAADIGRSGYAMPQVGRNYLYARLTGKEPWDILYFTPGSRRFSIWMTGVIHSARNCCTPDSPTSNCGPDSSSSTAAAGRNMAKNNTKAGLEYACVIFSDRRQRDYQVLPAAQ